MSSSKVVVWPPTYRKCSSSWENCEIAPFSATLSIRGQASDFPHSPSKPAAQGRAAQTPCPPCQIFCGSSGPPSTKANSVKPQLYKYLGPLARTLPPGSLGPLSVCVAREKEMLEPPPHSQWAPEWEQLHFLSHGAVAGSGFFKEPLCPSLHASLSYRPPAHGSGLWAVHTATTG